MRNGVVIGCVGVVAAAAIAVVVYTQPPSASSDLVLNRSSDRAVQKPAATPAKPHATPASPAARAPHVETAAAPVKDVILPAAYRVLLTRSIFCPHGVGGKAAGKSSEPTFTLRGVVQWPRGFVAFIENSASGESRAVRVGDSIGQKKVTNIDFHSVEYVEGKRAMKVAVGQTLGGITGAGNGSALATVRPQLD